jgi:membrane fusion protein, multidrug efflux system
MIKRLIVIVIAVAVLAFIGYRAAQNYQAKKAAKNQPVEAKVVPVETSAPGTAEFLATVKAAGNIQAESEVTLYSKVPGKVARTLVKMGSVVTPGMTVAVVARDEVGYDYKDFEVKSDVPGVVVKVLQNPGALVNPNVPLMNLVAIDTVKAVVAVDELKIRFIRLGLAAQVKLQAYPGETFRARVTNISPVSNPVSRTVDVEVSIPNPGYRLKPGMYAEAEFLEGKRTGLVVPIISVVERGGRRYVYLVVDGKAVQTEVATAEVQGDLVEVASGLRGGETVVTVGAGRLEHNDKVTVVGK